MSEIQQLTQQKESIVKDQEMLQNWISLKKNLSSKFKGSQNVFKALKKEETEILTVEDFQEFSKGLDLSLLFKDIELNEENFGKIWENWEYKQKQNEHKLQIINEKLKLQAMLDDKGQNNETNTDITSKNSIQRLVSNCESLDQLQEKLDMLVEEGQKQKNKQDIVQNESDCFSIYLNKKNEQHPEELYISKLQLKSNEDVEGNNEIAKKNIKSYIEVQSHHFRNKTELSNGTLLQSTLLNKESLKNNHKSYKQSYITEPQLQSSPQKECFTVRVQPKQNQQQITKSPYEERQQAERKSHKINRMKGDLQSYISQLFFHEREFRQNNVIYNRPSSKDQKGLAGFMDFKQYLKNPQEKPQFVEIEDSQTQRRFQDIRYKLDDFQQLKLSQYKYITKTQPNFSPERTISNSKVKSNQMQKVNTKYSPGNTHRLNLGYLKQEKEQNNQQIQDQQIESQILE